MRKSIGWSVLSLSVVAGMWFMRPDREPAPAVAIPSKSKLAPVMATSMPSAPHSEPRAPMPAAIPTAADEASKPLFIEYVEPTLRADAEGHLILDSEARNAFEILIGMSARELGQRQQRLVQQLPAVAAAQALDLLQRLSDYRSAAVQTFPRENPPANLDQARSMLSTLHQLRVDYLGEPAALALFQSEERAARRFIEALTPSAAANAGAADDARTTLVLHVVFGMYIVPRQPPRPLDSRTRDAASRGSTNISNSSKPPSTEWAIGSSQSSS